MALEHQRQLRRRLSAACRPGAPGSTGPAAHQGSRRGGAGGPPPRSACRRSRHGRPWPRAGRRVRPATRPTNVVPSRLMSSRIDGRSGPASDIRSSSVGTTTAAMPTGPMPAETTCTTPGPASGPRRPDRAVEVQPPVSARVMTAAPLPLLPTRVSRPLTRPAAESHCDPTSSAPDAVHDRPSPECSTVTRVVGTMRFSPISVTTMSKPWAPASSTSGPPGRPVGGSSTRSKSVLPGGAKKAIG